MDFFLDSSAQQPDNGWFVCSTVINIIEGYFVSRGLCRLKWNDNYRTIWQC